MKSVFRGWYRLLMLMALLAAFRPAEATFASQQPPPRSSRAAEETQRRLTDAEAAPLVTSAALPARESGAVQIRLQQATFDPLQTSPQLLSGLSQTAYDGDGSGYYLVQFVGPILPEWKERLVRAGASLHDYVPDFAFIVRMDQATANRVQTLEMVRWVGLYQPAYRLSNALLPTVHSPEAGKRAQLMVRAFTGEPAASLVKGFAGLGAVVLSQGRDTGGGTTFQLELPETEVVKVAHLPGVAWVQPRLTPILHNAVARSAIAMNKDAVENTLGLYGQNQIVVVGDTGFSTGNESTMHQDFRGHFYKGSWGSGTCGTWADAHGHGTHVAGSVLGNGVMDGSDLATHSYAGTNAGIAPEALLWGWGFCSDWSGLPDADPYPDYYGEMYAADPRVRVNTNSWGYDTTPGTYETFSRETDRFIWDHPDMVVLFAAGNDGTDGNSDGIVDAGSMGVPAGAKNIITVGASENERTGNAFAWGAAWSSAYPANPIHDDLVADDASGMAAFSSRGPVVDGRLKPDVVAPGSNVVSTRDDSTTGWGVYNDHYLYMGGTSMATPLAAGAVAIVREFYTETHSLNPTAALVKATLINGAYDMTPGQYRDEVPDGSTDDVARRADINQGWGRVDLTGSLIYEAPRQLWFHEHAGVETNDEYSAAFDVGYAMNPFRVSLVWSDRAGTEASHGALVNDLDLRVIAPGGAIYYGNDIIGDGVPDGDVDRVNNVEGVDLAPGVGSYTVIVEGYNVPSGPQPFALVVSGDFGGAGELDGVVSNASTGVRISDARVEAGLVPTGTLYATTTAADGAYHLTLAAGTYTVTASAYGYASQTVTGVSVSDGVTTPQNFALTSSPRNVITGTVTDANTGWPLYASVEIAPDGYAATTVWTDPWTGVYSATVVPNHTYTLTVAPWDGIPGYVGQSRQINVSADAVEDFALDVDAGTCEAPGYALVGLTESSESTTFPPTGWVSFRGPDGLGTAYDRVRSTTAYVGQDIYVAFVMEQDNGDGWYLDHATLEDTTCAAPTGGLIAGSVYDANTHAALTGATVSNEDGYARTTAATPGDPTIGDGFYVLYSPAGSKTFTATLSGYTPAVVNGVSVVAGETGGQDFLLDAGRITVDPLSLSAWLRPGGSTVRSFTLTNDGGVAAAFNVVEVGDIFTDAVADGGFEGGTPNPVWNEASTSFGTPLCDAVSCGTGSGTGPHTGTYWAWFGGIESTETGSVDQDVVIAPGPATLSFWLEIPAANAPITMSVYIDGDELFSVSQADAAQYNRYTQVVIDVRAYADGDAHNLKFHSVQFGASGGVSNIFVDDIALQSATGIDWLTEAPTSGALAPSGGAQAVQATFNAAGLTAGAYTGTLQVESNTVYSPQDVPVRLTVGAEFISQQTGAWSGSAWVSGTPAATDWVTITTGHTVTVDSAIAACYGLTILPGGVLVIPAGNTLTAAVVDNRGMLRQVKSIPGSGDVDFHLRDGGGDISYYGLLFDSLGHTMGLTTVDIHGAVIQETGAFSRTVGRWFDISPQSAATGIPTTFYYDEGELNGNDPGTLDVYHDQGSGQWELMTTLARGGSGAARYVTAEIGPDFSPFVLRSPAAPTAQRMHGMFAVGGGAFALGVSLMLLGGAAMLIRRRRQ